MAAAEVAVVEVTAVKAGGEPAEALTVNAAGAAAGAAVGKDRNTRRVPHRGWRAARAAA